MYLNTGSEVKMEQIKTNDEVEINLKELWSLLIRKLWIMALAGIGVGVGIFLINYFAIQSKYESTTKIYVLNKQDSSSAITYSDLQTGTQLTKDYMTLVTSRPVTEQVISLLKLDIKHEDLVRMISVENPADTRILNITVKYNDPYMTKQIADAVREASALHITKVMDIERVNMVEEANIPESPSSPNIIRNTVIGVILGFFIAAFIISLFYIVDDTIKTPDDIEKYLELSILSTIPYQKDMECSKRRNKEKKASSKRRKMKEKVRLDTV